MHNYGNFVRLLMLNTSKNTTTKKQEIKDKYKITSKEIIQLIEYTKNKLKDLGLELVGIDKNEVIDPLTSDKYLLRRSDNVISNTFIDKKISIIYCLILLDDGCIDFNKLVHQCNKINIFENDDIENYIRNLKKDNYINYMKVNEEYNVVLGYKYYIEYGNINILDIISL